MDIFCSVLVHHKITQVCNMCDINALYSGTLSDNGSITVIQMDSVENIEINCIKL